MREEKSEKELKKVSKPDLAPKWRQIGIYMTIPFVLAISPIMGWFIGRWLDEKFDTNPYLMYVGLFLGFIAGFRELYYIVKRFGNGE
jgi:F0F1-type ATP synthase assembly protein I